MENSKYKIFIIDDEKLIRNALLLFLEDNGFEVDLAESGENGLETMNSKKFDLAIVDMRLPGMNGNSFILKANLIDSNMKYIIHTGSTDYILSKPLIDIGLTNNNILTKPIVDLSLLKEKIISILSNI